MNKFSNILLTLDIDWAPDFVIDWVANYLIRYQVKATWFVTHASPAIDNLRSHPELFELGIHPNFLPNSTQGKNHDEVLKYCINIVPSALSMRTHSLVQSTPLLIEVLEKTNIKVDLSLFLLKVSCLQPFSFWFNKKQLIRIPCYWEDDYEMEFPKPCWQLERFKINDHGLKVFNFHPIHIYLNSCDMLSYGKLKKICSNFSRMTPSIIQSYVNPEEGAGTLFKQIVFSLSQSRDSQKIIDIYKNFVSL